MKKYIRNSLMTLLAVATLGVPALACDKDGSTTIKSSVGPGVVEYRTSAECQLLPTTSTNTVIIEKPVVLENTTRIIERQIIRERTTSGRRMARHRVKRHHVAHVRRSRSARIASNKVTTIERTITKPIIVEKPITIERPVIIEKQVQVPVDRFIERPVYVDRVVEKPIVSELKLAMRGNVVLVSREMRHVFIREQLSTKEARLMELINEGCSWAEVASELGYKSPNAAATIGYRVFDKILDPYDDQASEGNNERKRIRALEKWRARTKRPPGPTLMRQ